MNATPQPVDRSARIADKDRIRKAIYTFGCYMPQMRFTLAEVSSAFQYPAHQAWLRIQELKRSGYVNVLNETRNRNIVYEIATIGEKK